jgi:hypothetical protein
LRRIDPYLSVSKKTFKGEEAMLFEASRYLHIFAGFAALLLFWIPIVTKKGGKVHVRVGWAYVIAMAAVAVSALIMGVWRIFIDPEADLERKAFSAFLIFIAILSSAGAWYGMRVLRFKKRQGIHRNPVDLFAALMLLLSGAAISLYGFVIGFALIAWFPMIGIFLGFSQLLYWLRPPKTNMHWLFEHLISMMGCCIATVTAFLVFGAPRLLSISSVSPVLWFLPTIVMTPVISGFVTHYKKKYARKA